MKVIEILKESAEILGLDNQVEILSTATEDKESMLLEDKEISTLFNLFKFSARELCTNYIPVATKQTITTQELKFPIVDLKNYIRTISVTKNGERANYKIMNRNLVFVEDGEYEIEYASYPDIESVFDEIDFLATYSTEALVFGLCSYYSISKGLFDEFQIFHGSYIAKAESIRALKTFVMPQRRWEWEQKNV